MFDKLKNQIKVNCLARWIRLKQSGVLLEDLLKKRAYKSIAVYGFCEITICLVYELQNTDIDIVCILDRRGEEIPFDYICYKPNEVNHIDVDAIVITPVDDFEEIKMGLRQYISPNVEIISIEDVLYEL